MFQDFHLLEHWSVASPIFGFAVGLYLIGSKDKHYFSRHTASLIFAVLLTFWVWYWIGTRYKYHYADSLLYAQEFELIQTGEWSLTITNSNEWLWSSFRNIFINYGTVRDWYLGVAGFYIGCMCIAAYIFMPRHYLIAITFLFTSFSFFAFGTNGIRNGMATSIALLALAIATTNTLKIKILHYTIGLSLIYIASVTHHSLLLIFFSTLCAMVIKDTRKYIVLWILCILLSLIAGNSFQALFNDLIDDSRMSTYSSINVTANEFSRVGFRWDFILYSSTPILLGYYTLYKKHISNSTYSMLLNIYILANATWVCINSIAYSNRFAYLSWFMMPILIAYPLVNFNIFKNQPKVTGFILIGFNIFNLIIGL